MHVRSLLALALAALLAAPAGAQAQAKKSSTKAAAAPAKASPAAATTTAPGYSIGGWIGYETGDLSGLQLRGDFVYPYQKLTPQLDLSFVGSIGWSYLTHSEFGVDTTGNLLKFVPAARFTLPVNPQLSFFGDAGLGLYWDSVKAETTAFGVTQSASSSGVGFMLRFAVGGFYAVNPNVKIGVMLDLDPMFGDYEDTTFAFMAGATFRI